MSVLIGCIAGFCSAYAYLPNFYATQNADGLLPDIPLRFRFSLLLLLVIVPAVAFTVFSVLYAFLKLKRPALDLMYERKQTKIKNGKASVKELSFFTKPETRYSAQQKSPRIFYRICCVLLFGNGADVNIHDRLIKRNIRVDDIYDRTDTCFFVVAPVALRGR